MKRFALSSSLVLAASLCAPQAFGAGGTVADVKPLFARSPTVKLRPTTSLRANVIIATTYGLSSSPVFKRIDPGALVPSILVNGKAVAKDLGSGHLELTQPLLLGGESQPRMARLLASFDAKGKPTIEFRLSDNYIKVVQAQQKLQTARGRATTWRERVAKKVAKGRSVNLFDRTMQDVLDKTMARAEAKVKAASQEWSTTLFDRNNKLELFDQQKLETKIGTRKFIFLNEINDALNGSGGVYANQTEVDLMLKQARHTLEAFYAHPDKGKLTQVEPGHQFGPGFAATVESSYSPGATYNK